MNTDIEKQREKIKEEFRFYLSKVAKSGRKSNDTGDSLGESSVTSYLLFIEPDKLFDYNVEAWKGITSMYDITDPAIIEEIQQKLSLDDAFCIRDKKDNNGFRSNAISHYKHFLYARDFFLRKRLQEEPTRTQSEEPKESPLTFTFSHPRQIIYYGAPGTGKSHTIKREEDEGKITCIRTTFHPDSDYATFVGCYKPHKDKESKELTYEFVEQAFLSAYKQAWMNPDKEIALVIEEINRGNCAQVFGDIFQLLDRDEDGWSTYPIKADTDIADHLEGCNIPAYVETMKDRFGKDKEGNEKYPDRNWFEFMALPPNMSILATMNTSDQSLFPIDSAFKRRWDWRYIPICQGKSNGEDGKQEGELLDWTIETSAENNSWWDFLCAINGIIESTTHSEDKELGFFFCKANKEGVISAEKFVNKVVFYLWTDVFKTYGFRSDIFDKDADGKEKIAFKDFFNKETGEPNGETVKLFVENVMKHLPKEG